MIGTLWSCLGSGYSKAHEDRYRYEPRVCESFADAIASRCRDSDAKPELESSGSPGLDLGDRAFDCKSDRRPRDYDLITVEESGRPN